MIEVNKKLNSRSVLSRILKAAIYGSITYFIFYYLPTVVLSTGLLPLDYGTTLMDFTLLSVFFVVMGQLFSGTIYGCGFGIARALVIITYFFSVADGGIFSLILPITEVAIKLTIDISTILLMIVSVSLFDIAKNLLEAINILAQKSTKIDFI